jgi:hypothetical protein
MTRPEARSQPPAPPNDPLQQVIYAPVPQPPGNLVQQLVDGLRRTANNNEAIRALADHIQTHSLLNGQQSISWEGPGVIQDLAYIMLRRLADVEYRISTQYGLSLLQLYSTLIIARLVPQVMRSGSMHPITMAPIVETTMLRAFYDEIQELRDNEQIYLNPPEHHGMISAHAMDMTNEIAEQATSVAHFEQEVAAAARRQQNNLVYEMITGRNAPDSIEPES